MIVTGATAATVETDACATGAIASGSGDFVATGSFTAISATGVTAAAGAAGLADGATRFLSNRGAGAFFIGALETCGALATPDAAASAGCDTVSYWSVAGVDEPPG